MNRLKSMKFLSSVVIGSAVFDLFGGLYFILLVGADKSINDPPTHPFYAILLGSFLLCFAYLQFLSSFNIRRYIFNIGVALLSRVFYATLFMYYFIVDGFPTTFMPTAFIDLIWVCLIVLLVSFNDEVNVKDLFIPMREDIS